MDTKTNQSLYPFLCMCTQGKNMNSILMYYNVMLVAYFCFCVVSRKTTNIIVKQKCSVCYCCFNFSNCFMLL